MSWPRPRLLYIEILWQQLQHIISQKNEFFRHPSYCKEINILKNWTLRNATCNHNHYSYLKECWIKRIMTWHTRAVHLSKTSMQEGNGSSSVIVATSIANWDPRNAIKNFSWSFLKNIKKIICIKNDDKPQFLNEKQTKDVSNLELDHFVHSMKRRLYAINHTIIISIHWFHFFLSTSILMK